MYPGNNKQVQKYHNFKFEKNVTLINLDEKKVLKKVNSQRLKTLKKKHFSLNENTLRSHFFNFWIRIF